MEYVFDLGIELPKIEFDVDSMNLSGYGRSTINGVAFTSSSGAVDDGFNYSFGIMKEVEGEVYFDSRRIRKHKIHSPYFHNQKTELFPFIENAWKQIEELGIEMFRCRLSLLQAASDIPTHRDTCSEQDYCVKVHIPLITNESARFIFGDKSYKMDVGKAYLTNVAANHSFINPEPKDRYHIIADCNVYNKKLPLFCKDAKEVINFHNIWEDVMLGKRPDVSFFNQTKTI